MNSQSEIGDKKGESKSKSPGLFSTTWTNPMRKMDAVQGRGDQHRQGDKLSGQATGKQLARVFAGGGWWGPSAGACRPVASNSLCLGARVGRPEGSSAPIFIS